MRHRELGTQVSRGLLGGSLDEIPPVKLAIRPRVRCGIRRVRAADCEFAVRIYLPSQLALRGPFPKCLPLIEPRDGQAKEEHIRSWMGLGTLSQSRSLSSRPRGQTCDSDHRRDGSTVFRSPSTLVGGQ